MDGETTDGALTLDDNGWVGFPMLMLPANANRRTFEEAKEHVVGVSDAFRTGILRSAEDLRRFAKPPRGCGWYLVNRGQSHFMCGQPVA